MCWAVPIGAPSARCLELVPDFLRFLWLENQCNISPSSPPSAPTAMSTLCDPCWLLLQFCCPWLSLELQRNSEGRNICPGALSSSYSPSLQGVLTLDALLHLLVLTDTNPGLSALSRTMVGAGLRPSQVSLSLPARPPWPCIYCNQPQKRQIIAVINSLQIFCIFREAED